MHQLFDCLFDIRLGYFGERHEPIPFPDSPLAFARWHCLSGQGLEDPFDKSYDDGSAWQIVCAPEQFEAFSRAQAQMSSALSRLMVVSENYPQLKADRAFQDLAAQLEGTENRITVARNRYIESVQTYNLTVRQFPTNLTAMLFSMEVKPNFTVTNEAEISTAPKVDFSAP